LPVKSSDFLGTGVGRAYDEFSGHETPQAAAAATNERLAAPATAGRIVKAVNLNTTHHSRDEHRHGASAAPAATDYLRVAEVTKRFRSADSRETTALDRISLTVGKGEFLSIVGPSGCGKSTLLQIIAGLIPASSGEVTLQGHRVTGPPAEAVYVFQQYNRSLFPWRTVIENVAFAIEQRPLSRAQVRERAEHFLAQVGLHGQADKYPWELSGGMQQRVAIARALTAEPSILLMDEPFSAVDALTRLNLQVLLLEIWERTKVTIVFVTHDVDEAVYLADRIAVLTRTPATISETLAVEVERPRRPIETREDTHFLHLRHYLLDRLLQPHAEIS
jgi:NitT/TauT family transport system ATP-binding protein